MDKVQNIVLERLTELFDPAKFVFDPIIVEARTDYYYDQGECIDEYISVRIVADFINIKRGLDIERTMGLRSYIHDKLEEEGIYLESTVSVAFEDKIEWEYVRKHGWDYVEEHGWPPGSEWERD